MAWKEITLGDALINREGRYKPNDPVVVNLKRIDKINFSGQIYLSDKTSNTDMILIRKGDLVVSGINVEKGAITVYEGEEDVTATIHYSSYIFNSEKINIDFLKLFLRSPDFIQLLKQQVPGGIKTEIKPKHILPLQVYFPDTVNEQKVIATHFFLKENKFNKLTKNLFYQFGKVDDLNQAILKEALQGRLVKQNPKDESAHDLLKRIKIEKGKAGKKTKALPLVAPSEIQFGIPQSWSWCRLGDVVTMNRGRFSIRPRNDQTCYGGEHPFIQIGSLDAKGSIINEYSQTLNEKGLKASKKFPKNTILIAIVGGTIGNLGVLGFDMCFPDSIIGIIPQPYYNQQFILYFLRYVQPVIKEAAYQMAGQPNIKIPTLENLIIPLPPLKEQERIVAEIDRQFVLSNQLKENIVANKKKAENLLKTLLHEAFVYEKNINQIAVPEPSNVVELNLFNTGNHKIVTLAAEIIWQLHTQPTFGHLKLQKLIYLCQKTADMDLPTNFLKQAMGPYDPALMRSLDTALRENQWFEYQQGDRLKYRPLSGAGSHKAAFNKYFSNDLADIQFLIDNFKSLKSEVIEIVATLYACLDTILTSKAIYSEAFLLQRFYEWSDEKEKFSENQVKRVFKRMIEIGLVPQKFKTQ